MEFSMENYILLSVLMLKRHYYKYSYDLPEENIISICKYNEEEICGKCFFILIKNLSCHTALQPEQHVKIQCGSIGISSFKDLINV